MHWNILPWINTLQNAPFQFIEKPRHELCAPPTWRGHLSKLWESFQMSHHDRRIPRAQTVEWTVRMKVMFSTPVGPSMTICQHGTLMDCCHKLALTTICIVTIILRDTIHLQKASWPTVSAVQVRVFVSLLVLPILRWHQISLMLEKHYHPSASEKRHYPRVCAIGCDIHFLSILWEPRKLACSMSPLSASQSCQAPWYEMMRIAVC